MHRQPTIVITGISGMDGFYAADYWLHKGYKVIGVLRRTSNFNLERLYSIIHNPNLIIENGDITDLASLQNIIRKYQPDEFLHLAAMSHVARSWEYPIMTAEVTGVGTLNCLEAIRQTKSDCKFMFAGSSEQFGNSLENTDMLNELSPMQPESPYAAAKLFSYHMSRVYRRSYNLHASCAITFNHEAPMRGLDFVTRKITSTLAKIKWGTEKYIYLGNIKSKRDWGFSGDYVKCFYKILNHNIADDFVISMGEYHSVEEFLEIACKFFELDMDKILKIDQSLIRPKDVDKLLGDSTKVRNELSWSPKTSFSALVENMCQYDLHYFSTDYQMREKATNYLYPKGWSYE